MLPRRLLVSAWALLPILGMAQLPDNCEPLRAQIEQKIVANGVRQPDITVVNAETPAPGRVVGQCAQGRKKINYNPGLQRAPASAPAANRLPDGGETILTECKDGTVTLNGRCKP